jgi:cytochrome b involved in lipid metabolism
MLFDGRILDVKKWKEVHPGSKELIEKHLGEDISKRFRFIKHSDLSWAALYSLQIGYLK